VSFFILAADSRLDAATAAFSANAAIAAFSPSHDIALPAGRLLLFADQSGNKPAFHRAEDGDFAAALGSTLYRGEAGEEAMRSLYQEFDPARFDWQGLLGIHVILIRKRGRLYVFGDGLGSCKLYRSAAGDLYSNSFLAMCEIGGAKTFDIQACYEYVINGSVFGTRTLVHGITSLPAQAMLVAGETTHVTQLADPVNSGPVTAAGSLDDIAGQHIAQLDEVFGPIAAVYGDRLRLSFSGGFDSRLILAMLLRHGVRPTLFVYGDDDDEDVRIARQICAAESLDLQCVDKDSAVVDPGMFEQRLRTDLYAFDGWKVEQTLFDFGVDRDDRLARHRDGRVPLNGSLGEIYRNFHYMPDRPARAEDVVSTFYSQYDPRSFSRRFDESRYRTLLAAAMRDAIGAADGRLARHQIEALYPKFRGRAWTGRDAQINQRFGPMFFPFLEHTAANNTAGIPIRYKDLGLLQGRMIELVHARLAAYPSDYGFPLSGPRPWRYRLKTRLGTWRPPALRKLSFRLKVRSPTPRIGALSDEFLGRVMDPTLPLMGQLFRLERVFSLDQFGRIVSLEYLGQHCGLELPPA
jgi:asparagine synthase (glutamine-hydrolysing)